MRNIWNQHAYQVLAVRQDGTIPSSGERLLLRNHYDQAGCCNFRQAGAR